MNTEFYADRIAQFLVTFGVSAELLYGPSYDSFASEHTKGARPSTKGKHERGQARKARDRGGEKADQNRRFPNKKPGGWKGPWPPK